MTHAIWTRYKTLSSSALLKTERKPMGLSIVKAQGTLLLGLAAAAPFPRRLGMSRSSQAALGGP